MGRDGIVIGEPSGQLVAHRARGREVCAGEVVTARSVLTNASDIPFDSGLETGVVIGTRCRRSAVMIVSSAV